MGSSNSKPAGYSRTRLLGLDIVVVETEEALLKVQASGEVDRLGSSEVSSLPWLLRWWVPHTQLYSVAHETWSLPMRSATSATYPPCLAHITAAYNDPGSHSVDTSAQVSQAVDILLSDRDSTTDHRMRAVCAQAMWAYIARDEQHAHIPNDVITAAALQLLEPTEMFKPWKLVKSWSISKVYDYAQKFLLSTNVEIEKVPPPPDVDSNALPSEIVSDVAHVVFIMTRNAARLLNELYKFPEKDINELFRDLGLSETVLRLAKADGTLGGLLPEDEKTRKGTTVVRINLADIARQTGDVKYAFEVEGDRPCAAKYAVLEFGKAVQAEIRKRG